MVKKSSTPFKATVFIQKKAPNSIFKATTAQKKPGPRKQVRTRTYAARQL